MTIAIIDEHTVIGESLKIILSTYYTDALITYYLKTADFLGDTGRGEVDVIILDLLMPEQAGLDFMVEYRKEFDSSKFIIVSALNDANTIRYALRLGADAYVSKDESLVEIKRAIDSVMLNSQYLSTNIRKSLVDHILVDEKIVFHLTPRERQVLNQVCNGFTIKETAYHLKISVHTAQEHYKNIMKKFKVNRTVDLIVFAIKHGLYYVN
ncbi:response regulator transcription factor [Siphonobacter sp. SORGH_AS_1065]|uniref:response regulator n=1 Tax=Siphonobacter sp. SORGH_AS_1065 TaxID=3041795 RepID=UPI00278935AB|nr:response regulator transcription factor [Siphonobacter sp. SORGH_AS_1065]MDQ1090283.1 DNA-binding NarL/FixJ family response regulator [Siphonobacter sp. SORGH_AS_1065]